MPVATLQQAKELVAKYEQQKAATQPTDTASLVRAIGLLRPYAQQKEAADLLLTAYSNYWNQLGGEGKWQEALQQAQACHGIGDFKQANPTLRANFYYDMGFIHEKLDNRIDAVDWYEQSLEIYLKDPNIDYGALAENYNNLALAYEKIGRDDRSIDYLKKATQLWRQHAYENISVNITGLGNLISAYVAYGDARGALQWLDTLNNYVKAYDKSPLKKVWNAFTKEERWDREDFVLLTQVRVYTIAFMPKPLDSCIAIFAKKYAAPRNTYREEHLIYYLEALQEAGWYYKKVKQYDKALALYSKAGSLADSDFNRMKGEANMALLLYDMGQYPQAMPHAAKSLEVFAFPEESTSMYGLLALNAELNQLKGNDQKADSLLKVIFSRQLKKNIASLNFSQLTINDFSKYINHTQIVVFLKSGNRFLTRYQQYKKKQDLEQAARFYELAAALFNKYYLKDSYNPSIDELNKQINHRLLSTRLQLPGNSTRLEENISLLENNYSQHLWKKFLSRNAENLKVPTALMYKRNSLVLAKQDLTIIAATEKQQRQQLDSIEKELKKVDDQLNQINTSYYNFDDHQLSVKAIQQQLQPDQLMIRYMVTDSLVYAVGITKKELQLVSVGSVTMLRQLVSQAVAAMRNPLFNYEQPAISLYQQLIGSFTKLFSTHQRWVIIPDDFLSYLPFEPLLNQQKKPLIQQVAISYAYSLKLWQLQLGGNSKANGLVAFAPAYSSAASDQLATVVRSTRNGLMALPGTRPEAEKIIGLYNGRLFSDALASRNNFIASLGKYQVYHLAMHAVTDEVKPEQSGLIFSNNEPLYFSQLYGLNFPADLVVLSACNTGVGTLEHGEGPVSLSRALVYSGVRASVYSLWEVPDKETATLMVLFYEFLRKGMDKDKALAEAKKTFIQQNPSRSHPFYWAGFVVNGSTAPIKGSGLNWYLLAIAGVLIIAAGLFIGYRKKRAVS